MLEGYWRYLLWIKDKTAPRGKKPILDALKVAGHVTTIGALIDFMPGTPRITEVMDPCLPFHFPGSKDAEGKDLMKTCPGDSWSLTWRKK